MSWGAASQGIQQFFPALAQRGSLKSNRLLLSRPFQSLINTGGAATAKKAALPAAVHMAIRDPPKF
jgi:hypothetical protein